MSLVHSLNCRSDGSLFPLWQLLLTRDGRAPNGKQNYLCHGCGRRSLHTSGTRAYPKGFRTRVLAAYHERCSQRGVCHIIGISRETLAAWLKKAATLPPLETMQGVIGRSLRGASSDRGKGLPDTRVRACIAVNRLISSEETAFVRLS